MSNPFRRQQAEILIPCNQVMELWQVAMNCEMFTGILNPDGNPDLFTVDSVTRIFNRFELPVVFNKLTNKFFYDGSLNIGTAKLYAQGRSTFLFFNDFLDALSRIIDAVDISRGVDPRQEKLPYYSGIDRNRHKQHGMLQWTIKQAEIEVWPKRTFNRYSDHLNIAFFDFTHEKKLAMNQEKRARVN